MLVRRLFEPLGYEVDASPVPLDVAEWGDSRYVSLRLSGYRVHECVFAILALESEPVDPRL